jgi:SPP1 family predicted phage head-tail adaptor
MATTIGKLDRRVTLFNKGSGTLDSWGQPTDAVAAIATVWATVTGVSGSESLRIGKIIERANVVFRVRYRGGLKASRLTVEHEAKSYEVIHVDEVERRRFIDLYAFAIDKPETPA